MSKGQEQVGFFSKGFHSTNYLHLRLTPKDWCTYEGTCRMNQLVFGSDHICDNCQYKKRVDIPTILEELDIKINGNGKSKRI